MTDPHLTTPTGKRRARALGIPFQGRPGRWNAITDVPGVAVGYRTLIAGDGPLVVGKGPVRTGVTAIHPRGRDGAGIPVFAGVHSLNGAGEMTGFVWIEEAGRTELPIVVTNTHSVGLARDALAKWMVANFGARMERWVLPVAAETYDGHLNDINGFHVGDADVFAALDDARGGAIDEGSVGGGTGMICYEFKGGSGTASRVVELGGTSGHVGAFVQANFGRREQLAIAGLPVGRWLAAGAPGLPDHGSVIAVVATDLPLLPHQLKRLARRAGLGIGRSGSIAAHGSGDIFIAFSTANSGYFADGADARALSALPDGALNPVFESVIQAVDEAVLNALVANTTMVGRDGHVVEALPHAPVERWCGALRRADAAP
ncbi:MAG: P1 family peptidase [Alphaproteobacteria bacterium]|nr:P1 family peptidase [Alphaproteobacteria bacterium]